jgi:UDP-N-acetylmuramoyl-L-alanine---L-glutamate ligase
MASKLTLLKKYDVVIKSPGIPARLVRHDHIISATNIFFAECPAPIIGITGTKGKSTTASMLYDVLSQKYKTWLVGNIGKPALDVIDRITSNDLVVYELSSFQLEHLKQSPHIAILLNLYAEHLDHHGSFGAYKKAKEHIYKYQTEQDILVYNASLNPKTKAKKISFNGNSIEAVRIIAKLYHVDWNKAIKNFTSLPHRLERVGTYRGITFYNDSLATIPEAVIFALEKLGQDVHTVILGGYDRGVPMKKLRPSLRGKTRILLPTTGKKFAQEHYYFAKNMKEAVRLGYEHTPKGKICLLSPAASSFNMFTDYRDRGDQFKKFVRRYAH